MRVRVRTRRKGIGMRLSHCTSTPKKTPTRTIAGAFGFSHFLEGSSIVLERTRGTRHTSKYHQGAACGWSSHVSTGASPTSHPATSSYSDATMSLAGPQNSPRVVGKPASSSSAGRVQSTTRLGRVVEAASPTEGAPKRTSGGTPDAYMGRCHIIGLLNSARPKL